MRVEQITDRAAVVNPDGIALVNGAWRWTYRELAAERDRRAGVLVEAGLQVGERVVMAGRITGELVVNYLACARAGGIFVGLSALLTEAELAALTARLAPAVACCANGEPRPGLRACRILPLDLPGTPGAAALNEAARRSAAGGPEDPCEIRVTSGTTNERTKLVVVPHRTYTWRCRTDAWETPEARVHAALSTNIFQPAEVSRTFAAGGTVLIPQTIGVFGLEEELAERGATDAVTSPALLAAMVRQETPPPAALRLHALRTSGAALPREVRQLAVERYGAVVIERYGTSECIAIMASPVTGTPPGSVGKPNPGVEVRLLDAAGNEVAEGTTAEMVVRSPSMMLGYLDDPEATAAILRDGWLYTGDLAHRDAEGFYYIEGRRGLQINVGGSKVAPEEVEAVLLQHPGVREVVVVPQPDALRGEVVKAIVVPEGANPEERDLRRFCRARLASYKVPRHFEFRSEPLPRSPLGKVLRRKV